MSSSAPPSREKMIAEILGLQNSLSETMGKVDSTKGENIQLKEENEVLREYIENLVANMNKQEA